MWFKNLQLHRLPVPWHMTPEEFADQLRSRLFQPCGGLNRESRGWIPPRGDERLVYAAHGHWLIALGMEQKLLPSAVVNQEAKVRAAEIEARMGVAPGRKRMKELKEEIFDELLPRAFSRYFTTFAWVDPVNGWLVIEGPANTSLQPTLPVIYTVTMRGLSDMTLSGSGTITVNDLSAESLETTVSGSGSIVVTGTIDRQQVTISGAGAYDASKVDGTDAGVTVSGMGNARLNVSGTLDATISGAGNIMYSGGATVTQNITGAGQVVGE